MTMLQLQRRVDRIERLCVRIRSTPGFWDTLERGLASMPQLADGDLGISCEVCEDPEHEVWQLLGESSRCLVCGPLGLGCIGFDDCFPEGEG